MNRGSVLLVSGFALIQDKFSHHGSISESFPRGDEELVDIYQTNKKGRGQTSHRGKRRNLFRRDEPFEAEALGFEGRVANCGVCDMTLTPG